MIVREVIGRKSDGDYDYEIYNLKCDACGRFAFMYDKEITDEEFLTFERCLEYKKMKAKSIGWTCRRSSGKNQFIDLCPVCSERSM